MTDVGRRLSAFTCNPHNCLETSINWPTMVAIVYLHATCHVFISHTHGRKRKIYFRSVSTVQSCDFSVPPFRSDRLKLSALQACVRCVGLARSEWDHGEGWMLNAWMTDTTTADVRAAALHPATLPPISLFARRTLYYSKYVITLSK